MSDFTQDSGVTQEAKAEAESEEEIGLNPFWKRFKFPINKQYTLLGHSRAAEKSCFLIPELGVFFDAGLQSLIPPNLICITHCHSDHSQALPLLLTNSAITGKVPILVPEQHKTLFIQYVRAHFQLSTGNTNYDPNMSEIIGVKPGETYNFQIKSRDYQIECFQCLHTVPAIGYGLSELRKKLKKEYQSLKPQELVELRKTTEISHVIANPIIVYLCDTTYHVLENQEVYKYPIIMIEVTMLYPEHENHANANKHICWNQIQSYVINHPDNLFILIHFSMRYKWKEITDFFDNVKTTHSITNILIWKN